MGIFEHWQNRILNPRSPVSRKYQDIHQFRDDLTVSQDFLIFLVQICPNVIRNLGFLFRDAIPHFGPFVVARQWRDLASELESGSHLAK
jgi:hypothetical protein